MQVMGVYSENEPTSQTSDCTYLREQCLRDANGCKHAWRIMEDACSVSGKATYLKYIQMISFYSDENRI